MLQVDRKKKIISVSPDSWITARSVSFYFLLILLCLHSVRNCIISSTLLLLCDDINLSLKHQTFIRTSFRHGHSAEFINAHLDTWRFSSCWYPNTTDEGKKVRTSSPRHSSSKHTRSMRACKHSITFRASCILLRVFIIFC